MCRVVLALFFGLIAWLPCAHAESWQAVGKGRAQQSYNKISFHMIPAKTFTKLRFEVKNGQLWLQTAKLFTENGEAFKLSIQKMVSTLEPDSVRSAYSQTFALSPKEQTPLTKIELTYKYQAVGKPDQPLEVTLFGQ